MMNRTLFLKTLRDVRANLAQSLALILIVALGISSFIALVGAYRDLDRSYRRTYEELRFADVTFRLDAAPADVAAEVRGLEGVLAASGRYVLDTGLELADGEPIRARLIGLPAGEQPAVNRVLVENGDYLPEGTADSVLVEAHHAEVYDLALGDTVTPIVDGDKVPLAIVGVAATPEYLIVSPSQQDIFPSARTFAVLFLPLPRLQALAGAPDTINEIAVLVAPEAEREVVIGAIEARLERYGLERTMRQEDVPSNAALQQDLAGYAEIAVLMPGLILLVAAISVYVMLGRMVSAQQPQIGVMKALGYGDRAVLAHYLLFALLVGVAGTIIGVATGLPLARAITSAYATELGIPRVETAVYPDLVAIGVFLSLLLALLAGLGPARQSAGLAPAEAMRLDPASAKVQGRISLPERVLPLPLWLRLPVRNVFRLRRRTFTTVLGIIFAFVLVLMVWGMFDSMGYFVSHTFEDVERWDLIATFDRPQNEATVRLVEGWDGVTEVVPTIQLPATVSANGEEQNVLLTAFPPEQEMHMLQLGDTTASTALAPGRIVLTDSLVEQLGLAAGGTVDVDTPFATEHFTLGGSSDELMSAAAYISLADAQALSPFPNPIYNGLYLTVAEGHAAEVKRALYRLPGTASVQLKADMRRDIESLLGLFYAFMGVMLFFAIAMAAALIFNAMTVNVLERQRELATMRAIGTGRGRLALEISLENVILWLLALVPGLLLGTWVGIQMGEAFSAELFAFEVVISPASYLVTALGILATMLLAALPAIRRVNRLDLAEATKILT